MLKRSLIAAAFAGTLMVATSTNVPFIGVGSQAHAQAPMEPAASRPAPPPATSEPCHSAEECRATFSSCPNIARQSLENELRKPEGESDEARAIRLQGQRTVVDGVDRCRRLLGGCEATCTGNAQHPCCPIRQDLLAAWGKMKTQMISAALAARTGGPTQTPRSTSPGAPASGARSSTGTTNVTNGSDDQQRRSQAVWEQASRDEQAASARERQQQRADWTAALGDLETSLKTIETARKPWVEDSVRQWGALSKLYASSAVTDIPEGDPLRERYLQVARRLLTIMPSAKVQTEEWIWSTARDRCLSGTTASDCSALSVYQEQYPSGRHIAELNGILKSPRVNKLLREAAVREEAQSRCESLCQSSGYTCEQSCPGSGGEIRGRCLGFCQSDAQSCRAGCQR